MASPSYVALGSTVDDSSSNATMKFSRYAQDTQEAKQQQHQEEPYRFSKKMSIAATASLMIVLALVVCVVVLPPRHQASHANIVSSSGSFRTSSTTTISAQTGTSKADAVNEHLNALDYMEKKRKDEKPYKKTSLRSSSMVTQQGGQLDPLLSKEDLQEFTFTVVSTEDEKQQEEVEVEAVTDEVQVQATEEEEEEEDTEEDVDDEVIKNEAALEEHLEALGYVDQKRQVEHSQKKASVRSSSVITKNQLDPLLTKEELDMEEAEYMNVDLGADASTLEEHVDALAYMDKKRQEAHSTKKTSVRASSMVTKDQLDPILAKEELETVVVVPPSEAIKPLADHVDALAYMDKKRQNERPKKSSLRASSMITKGRQELDPLLAKEELSVLVKVEKVEEGKPMFEVVVEDPIVNGQTQRRMANGEEEQEAESDESSSDESQDESEDETSSNDTTSSDEGDEITEEFLEHHQWSEKDFKVIDFTTEDYETVDLNRIGGGE